VATGTRAVELERVPFVVGRVFEVLLAPVAVSAELLAVNRVEEGFLVHVEVELLPPFGIRLQLFVSVTIQTVRVVIVFIALGREFSRRGLS
jgi:hypothetical protein